MKNKELLVISPSPVESAISLQPSVEDFADLVVQVRYNNREGSVVGGGIVFNGYVITPWPLVSSRCDVNIQYRDGTLVPALVTHVRKDILLACVKPQLRRKHTFTEWCGDGSVGQTLFQVTHHNRTISPVQIRGRYIGAVKCLKRIHRSILSAMGSAVFTAEGEVVGLTLRTIEDGNRTFVLPIQSIQHTINYISDEG